MKWVIKNPAPSDSRRRKWGDFHFGRALTKYLERHGQQVTTQYDPGWGENAKVDVVLVLRGKYPYPAGPEHPGALRVMWNISHPGDVSLEEYASYDLVCVASRPRAAELQQQLEVPVRALLQCTDPEEFRPVRVDPQNATDVVFIGNTRDVEREGVLWALDYGLPVKIWGRGWEAFGVPRERIVGDYFPNEELGALYGASRATLNDHWGDMKEHGFINNRIFDAIACGLPVVSDWHPELESLLPGAVLMYRNRGEFDDCMTALLLDHPRLVSETAVVGRRIREEYSFARRAAELVQLVGELLPSRG